MNSANGNSEFPEELLSGYLDGELSGEEQSRVEDLLRNDSQAQQVLEDLQQRRHCLQQLPQQQPSSKLREKVSQRISEDTAVQLAGTESDAASNRSVTPWLVATAAGLALLVALPMMLNQPSTQVADQAPADPAATAAPAMDEYADSSTEEMSAGAGGMMAAMDGAGELPEAFDPDIPLVYINVTPSIISRVPAILAANGITVDSQYTAPARELAAAGFGSARRPAADPLGNDDVRAREPADRDTDKRNMQDVTLSVLIVDASPEQLARIWEQLSKTKSTVIAQQTGARLPGISYAPEEAKLANARRVMSQDRQRIALEVERSNKAFLQQRAGDPNAVQNSKLGESQQALANSPGQAKKLAGSARDGGGKAAPVAGDQPQVQRKADSVRVRLIIQASP